MKKKSLLSIAPKAEFSAPVSIPCPDREPEVVEFTFIYRDREQMEALVDSLQKAALTARDEPSGAAIQADVDMVLKVATGWDLSDDFTPANVRELLIKHSGAPIAIYEQYVTTSRLGKQKN